MGSKLLNLTEGEVRTLFKIVTGQMTRDPIYVTNLRRLSIISKLQKLL